MAKTKFVDNVTVLRSSFNNTIYGGLEGTPEGAGLPDTDPLIGGHVHDGTSEDGHAQKINLADHVTGELDGEMIQDSSIPHSKLRDEQRVPFGSSGVNVFDSGSGALETVVIGPVSEDTILKEIFFRGMDKTFALSFQKLIYLTSVRIGDGETYGPNLISGLMPSVVIDPRYSFIFPTIFNEVISAGGQVELIFADLTPSGVPDPGGFPVFAHATGVPGSSDTGLIKETFLGCDALGIFSSQVGAVRASTTYTVNTSPLDAGDTIELNLPFQGIKTLTGVSGARTSGNDDFQVDAGSADLIAADIADAINDAANSFSDYIEATSSTNTFTLTYWDPGDYGNLVEFENTTTSPSGITPTSGTFENGVPGTITFSFAVPSDMTLKRLFLSTFSGGSSSGDKGNASVAAGNDAFFDVSAIRINGGANLIDGRIPTLISTGSTALGDLGILATPNFDIDVSTEDTIEVDILNQFNLPSGGVIGGMGWTVELR
jgi:hypothetical protein